MKIADTDIRIRYLKVCPVDAGEADAAEIISFGECRPDYERLGQAFWDLLAAGRCADLGLAAGMCRLEGLVRQYAGFFRQRLNLEPFRLTLYWARKFFSGQSFALTAPTGYGKTTFGITLAGFIPGKVCYIVPTRLLLNQVAERLKRVAGERRVLAVRSPKDRPRLEAGDFDILVITGQFLHARFDLVTAHRFDLIFIDDTDSLVRRPRNVDKVLRLAGFTPDEIAAALSRTPDSSRSGSRAAVKGQVIAASATLDLRSRRVGLFRELLKFEVGSTATLLRNIVDAFLPVDQSDLLEVCAGLIRRLGPGGFVFLSERWRREDLAAFVAGLRDRGINAVSYQRFSAKAQAAFSRGEIEVAVGFSSVRNPLVRGIDLPEAVRYTLFVGVPALRIPLAVSYVPAQLFMVLVSLRDVLQPYWPSSSALIQDLRFLRDLGPIPEDRVLGDPGLKARVEVIKGRLEAAFADPDFWVRVENHPTVVVRREETGPYLLIADARGYVQASGRCSRLFPLGLTRGLSVVLVEDGRVFEQLQRRLRTFGYEVGFQPLDRLDLPSLLREVDRDRQLVRQALAGEPLEVRDPVRTCLVVVESPTKARTIAAFFGRPSVQIYDAAWVYEVSIGNYLINVAAILGHFTDLTTGVGTYGVGVRPGVSAHQALPGMPAAGPPRSGGLRLVRGHPVSGPGPPGGGYAAAGGRRRRSLHRHRPRYRGREDRLGPFLLSVPLQPKQPPDGDARDHPGRVFAPL